MGEVKLGFHGYEMIHPKVRDADGTVLADSLTPIYPTVNGLQQPTLRRGAGCFEGIAFAGYFA